MFSVLALKKVKIKEVRGRAKWTERLRITQQFKRQAIKDMKWGAKFTLLGSKWNSPSRAVPTCSLSEACHSRFLPEARFSIYSHLLCCLIFFQERLQLPPPLEALKLLFSKPQTITDFHQLATPVTAYCSLYQSPLPTWRDCVGLQTWLAQHLVFKDLMLNFFIQVKFSLLLASVIFSTFLGFCLTSYKWALQKWRCDYGLLH